jgi:hypothetical protein
MSDFPRIIFLDIDGVLLPHSYLISGKNISLYEDFKKNRDLSKIGHQLTFDPACMSNLRQIIEKTDCSIVMISTWRYSFNNEELQDILLAKGFEPNWFHSDPCDRRLTAKKYNDVGLWLGDHSDEDHPDVDTVFDYLIIDDDDVFQSERFKTRHIMPDYDIGLTKAHVDSVLAIWD